MGINPFSDIRIAGIFFLFTLLIVSFINSVLKTGSPGHIAGEVQERDLNLAVPEPGRLTRVLSFLAGASASLIFMIPHNQQNFVGPWWYLGCCDVSLGPRAYSWYRESVSTSTGEGAPWGGRPWPPRRMSYAANPSLRGLPTQTAGRTRPGRPGNGSHIVPIGRNSGFESLACVPWPWAPGRDTASVSLSHCHLQAHPFLARFL